MFFTKSHEWIELDADKTYTMGISDHAQSELSDVVFVDLPEIGKSIQREEQLLAIDSVKAASDIFAPVSGEVVAVNEKLRDEPELINASAEKEGWILKIKISDSNEIEKLLSKEEYKKFLAES